MIVVNCCIVLGDAFPLTTYGNHMLVAKDDGLTWSSLSGDSRQALLKGFPCAKSSLCSSQCFLWCSVVLRGE